MNGKAERAEGRGAGRPALGTAWARRAAIAMLAVFFLLAARYGWGLGARAEVGRSAPDFSLPRFSGGTIELQDLRGTVVLINFWASWCPPCREEAPALQSFAERYAERVIVLGVNERERRAAIAEFRERFALKYPLLLDQTGAVGERYGLRAMPESWMIDADGVARVYHVGPMTFEDLQAAYRQTTGEEIDGTGVGPVAAGRRATALALAGGRLFVATDVGLFAAAADAGLLADPAAWTGLGLKRRAVHGLAADASGLYAATDDGLWRLALTTGSDSAASGTWARVGLEGEDVRGIGADPATGTYLAWVPGRGLFRSRDGRTWTLAPSSLDPELPWLALAPDPSRPQGWYAGFAGGLFASVDGGLTWRRLGLDIAIPAVAAVGERVYLATDRGLWLLNEGFRVRPLPGPTRLYTGVAAGPGGAWSLAPNGDVYRLDGGIWRRVTGSSQK